MTTATLTTRLHNLALMRGNYRHVRWIDAEGREQIRIDSTARDVAIAPAANLADWSRSNLFARVQRLRDQDIYASSFELRTDHGKVVDPFEPLLRFAMPLVGTNGERNGFVALDMDMRASLASLRVANPNGFVELLTNDGHWIKSSDPHREWGSVLREREGALFSTLNARAWGAMLRTDAGHVRGERGAFWFRVVRPPLASDAPSWKLVLHAPSEVLRARNLSIVVALACLALAAALMAAPFYWWLARKAAATTAQAASS